MAKKKKNSKKIIAIVLSIIIFIGAMAFLVPYVIIPKLEIENLYYDDQIDVSGKWTVILDEGEPTSNKIDSEDEKDDAVLTLYKNKLIATGVGNAKVMINGRIYNVTVSPAPISIFMITGHSLGAGECGNVQESVVCEEGQVYSSHGKNNLTYNTEGVGLTYTAEKKANNYNAFTKEERGTVGEGSALGYEWNRLTGEKAYILNTAVGGSCINTWTYDGISYRNAVNQFKLAQEIVSNEIVSGHFTLSKMGIIYHNAANFSFAGLTEYTEEDLKYWYKGMWDGFKEELIIDMEKDGTYETLDFLGIAPLSSETYTMDKPWGLYFGASSEYEDVFNASVIGTNWLTDEGIQSTFPEINYPLRDGITLNKPTTHFDVYSQDDVHYNQVAYNAVGIDIAKNLYAFYFGSKEVLDVKLYKQNGELVSDTVNMVLGETIVLSPVVNPISINNLTFIESGAINVNYGLQITASNIGTGTLTIKYNDTVIKTITFNCN